jgi:hypothetical protein
MHPNRERKPSKWKAMVDLISFIAELLVGLLEVLVQTDMVAKARKSNDFGLV